MERLQIQQTKAIRVLSISGSVGGPWVTLRSPTAKSLRLTPSGSRLSGDRARGVVVRRGRWALEAPIELQVGGGVAAVGTAMLSSVVVNLVEVELQFQVLQNPIFSRDAVDGLGG